MMFDSRYEVVLADTEDSKEIHYALRYRVFCLEKRFENPTRFGRQMEMDQYDSQAVHFLVKDRVTNNWIAAARLIFNSVESLPISTVANIEIPERLHNVVIAEFSRLLILNSFRHSQRQAPAEPEILLGLIRAAREYSLSQNTENWVFLCRRAINRILGSVGIAMEQIGPACVYRGIRVPYLMDLNKAFDNVPRVSPRTHQMFSRTQTYFCYSDLYNLRVA
ncbi:PEP-CTERM/exosortase system-associated acyltransferase [Methylocaldum szegediense]|nr:PEP-CTERM/exosortase system-associated acyltransferase [Methylocaldum szegediense]